MEIKKIESLREVCRPFGTLLAHTPTWGFGCFAPFTPGYSVSSLRDSIGTHAHLGFWLLCSLHSRLFCVVRSGLDGMAVAAESKFKDYIAEMDRYEGLIMELPKELAVKCALLWCIKSLYHIPQTREQVNGYMDIICRGILKLKDHGDKED